MAIWILTIIILWEGALRIVPFPEDKLQPFRTSPLVTDVHGRHLLSIVSDQQQWHWPVELNKTSPWLTQATLAIEDHRFYQHSGVDPLAVLRASWQNTKNRQTISGASTLTMQICRMLQERPRTLPTKAIEAFRACQLEQKMGKDQILELYLNNAPYGGNIRGVEAASLFYFSRHADDISLAQAALLAGLPQSPTRYNPRKHLSKALNRQKAVLDCMVKLENITQQQYEQALNEQIQICSFARIPHAPHVSWMALKQNPTGGQTCINLDIQQEIENTAAEHLITLPHQTELAVTIIDIERSCLVTLIGSGDPSDPVDGQVNGAFARRSPGSALKPFIYAAAFEAQRLSPDSIVYDVPIQLAGWSPGNFDRTYSGPVTAGDALRHSLNIPALWIANCLGMGRCCNTLESLGIRLPDNTASRIGLSIVVGGSEVSLFDLTNAYATFGRGGIYRNCRLFPDDPSSSTPVFNSNVCAAINSILSSENHTPRGMENIAPQDIGKFMWKTGTSSGRRDAWALGHNGQYAIGVWVGRFRGTGRFEYVGSIAAEPLLAKLFSLAQIRNNFTPVETETIVVKNPLPRPYHQQEKLQILSPQNGDIFIALNASVSIHPQTNQTGNVKWLLNDDLVPNEEINSLNVTPGSYTLHCINSTGQFSKVTFSVQKI